MSDVVTCNVATAQLELAALKTQVEDVAKVLEGTRRTLQVSRARAAVPATPLTAVAPPIAPATAAAATAATGGGAAGATPARHLALSPTPLLTPLRGLAAMSARATPAS